MNIIAFTGLKRSGKDTAAEYFTKFGYKRLSFASKLKEVVANYFGCVSNSEDDREEVQEFIMRFSSIVRIATILKLDANLLLSKTIDALEPFLVRFGDDCAVYRMSYRQVLQLFGTEACRAVKDDIWVQCVVDEINSNPNGKYVISDLRFDNEAVAIRNLGGKIIQIERDGTSADGHSSEKGVSKSYINGSVKNTTFEDLYSQLEVFLDKDECT